MPASGYPLAVPNGCSRRNLNPVRRYLCSRIGRCRRWGCGQCFRRDDRRVRRRAPLPGSLRSRFTMKKPVSSQPEASLEEKLGPADIARRLGINRASVYRALGLTPTVVRRYCTTQRSCAPRSASTSASKPPASDALSPVPEPVGTIGGRQLASGSRRGSSSGKSCSNTGPSVRSSNLRAVSKTRRWNTGSMGGPKGHPSSNGTHSARGGRVFSVCGRIRLIETVARPSSSR